MIAKFLLMLGIGHVLGDFYCQTDKMAEEKDKSFKGVLYHSLEYAVCMLTVVLPTVGINLFATVLLLALSHFAAESTKYVLLKKEKVKKTACLFIADQACHLFFILIAAYYLYNRQYRIETAAFLNSFLSAFGLPKEKIARWALALLLIHKPSNILIQSMLNKNNNQKEPEDKKVGRKIGSIERLIMLMFIALNEYTAMGVVLTAKSIARFDKIQKDEEFAEYYLLGTLLSTACVIVCKIGIL